MIFYFDILIVSPVANEIRDEINNVVVDIVINDEEFISAHLMSEDHFNETMNFPFLTNVLEAEWFLDEEYISKKVIADFNLAKDELDTAMILFNSYKYR